MQELALLQSSIARRRLNPYANTATSHMHRSMRQLQAPTLPCAAEVLEQAESTRMAVALRILSASAVPHAATSAQAGTPPGTSSDTRHSSQETTSVSHHQRHS
jgi:hypothetical protein